jgi:hypothetical protein
MEWSHDPNQNNVDNANNIRCKAHRTFRYKKREYLRSKINEFETNSTDKTIRELYAGIIEFIKVYQPRTSIAKEEKGTLVTDSHSTLILIHCFLKQHATDLHSTGPQYQKKVKL